MSERKRITVAEFKEMTGYHDKGDEEINDIIDQLDRFAEICLTAAQDEIRREEAEKKP